MIRRRDPALVGEAYGRSLLKVNTLRARLEAHHGRSLVMRTLKLSLSLLAAATVLGPLAALSAYAATILAAAMVAP
jgi:hypothetical protein